MLHEQLKRSIAENLKKTFANISHKEFLEKDKKSIALENFPDENISISLDGFFYESKIVSSLLKTSSLKDIFSRGSLWNLVSDIAKKIYEKRKISSADLKDKTLMDFIKEDDIYEEIDKFEAILFDKKNIKNWKILLPLSGVVLKDINEVDIGDCNIFILDEEKHKKFANKKKEINYGVSFFWGISPSFETGGTYLETSSFGYHGTSFERSKVVEDAEEKIRKCYSILKIIIKLFKLKSKSWFPVVRPNYWRYIYEEGNERKGTYRCLDEQIVIGEGTYTITRDQIEKLKKNYPFETFNKLLVNKSPNQIEQRILRALEWFSSGFDEKNESHQYIQFCVALESLLGKKDPFSHLTIELAERVAFLWTRNMNKRIRIKSDFKKNVFSLRGKILHGGYSLRSEDFDCLNKLERAVVISMIQILRNVETIKNDNDLDSFFDQERFYPSSSLSPEMLKEMEDIISKRLEDIKKGKEDISKQLESIVSKK